MPHHGSDRYSVQDYQSWDDDQRWELINGQAFAMSPAPTPYHQEIAGTLYQHLANFLGGKPCKPYISPVDVYLSEDTVVQPDVLVVCNPGQVTNRGINGAPTFVAEVMSHSTAHRDMNHKRRLYETHGVLEYWLISPEDGTVLAYRREGERFGHIQEYRPEEEVPSVAIEGFVMPPRNSKDSANFRESATLGEAEQRML